MVDVISRVQKIIIYVCGNCGRNFPNRKRAEECCKRQLGLEE